MIHEPLISGGFGGSSTSIKHTADSIMETKKLTVTFYGNGGEDVKDEGSCWSSHCCS